MTDLFEEARKLRNRAPEERYNVYAGAANGSLDECEYRGRTVRNDGPDDLLFDLIGQAFPYSEESTEGRALYAIGGIVRRHVIDLRGELYKAVSERNDIYRLAEHFRGQLDQMEANLDSTIRSNGAKYETLLALAVLIVGVNPDDPDEPLCAFDELPAKLAGKLGIEWPIQSTEPVAKPDVEPAVKGDTAPVAAAEATAEQ